MLSPGRILLLAFLVAALGAFLAMRLWTMPLIRAGAGGRDMFDLLIDGYSPAYVADYLAALGDDARTLYLGPQRLLDTILPVALTGTLATATYLMARRWSLVLGLALALVPLFYFAFDMLENAQLAVILTHRAASAEMAEAASRFTMAKAQALRFAIGAVTFVGLARAAEALLTRAAAGETGQ